MRRTGLLALAGLLVLAAGCPPPPGDAPGGNGSARRTGDGGRPAPPPRVPPGVRLVSFDAERDMAAAGGFLEPGWCVQLSAEARDADGRPAEGVPVSFRLDRRSGRGLILAAALSHETVLTDARGRARALLVSSDRPERCRVYATCGPVSLGALVRFTRRRPSPFTVGLAGPEPERRPPPRDSPEAELDARVARLVTALGKGGPEAARVRREITAMGRGAIGPLLRMIYNEHRPRSERRLAARALAMVKDELVLDQLLRNLDDWRAAVRAGAEAGLFERGVERAGRGVRRKLALGGPFGRASALRVLAAWARRADVTLLAARAGADLDPLVRATAAWKLKAFQDRAEARLALRAAMADGSAFVRYTAAKAQGLVPAVSGRGDRPPFLADTLRDRDPRVRAAAARTCRAPGSTEVLLRFLEDRDVRVRRAAAESLGFMPAGAGSPAGRRLHELVRDRDEHVAGLAFRALVRRGGRGAASYMLAALGGEDRVLAGLAVDSLERVYRVELGRPRFGALPSEELLGEWKQWVRACRGSKAHHLYWLAAERRDSRLRGEALLELVRAGPGPGAVGRRAGKLAAEMVKSSDARVRAPAAAALWLLGERRGRDLLLKELASRDWPARYAACRAAGRLRHPDAVDALVVLLGDESAAIRDAAHRSLRAMRTGGPAIGFDPEGPPAERGAKQALWKKWAEAFRIERRKGTGRKPG